MAKPPQRGVTSDEHAKKAQAEMERFWEDLDNESDRGMVLSAGAYFEKFLADCLSSYLNKSKEASDLLSSSRELGSFSSRNKMCVALRILAPEEAHALKLLSQVRNEFAHRVLVAFEEGSVGDRVREFSRSALGEGSPTWQDVKEMPLRKMFSFSLFCLSDRLWLRPYDVHWHTENYADLIPYHMDTILGDAP